MLRFGYRSAFVPPACMVVVFHHADDAPIVLRTMVDIEHGYYDPDHPVFAPLADDAVLWRYMDLTKLVSLLEYRALHFGRADLLGDPFEGSLTARMLAPPMYARDEQGQLIPADDETQAHWVGLWSRAHDLRVAARRQTWISCWNHSAIESDALWVRYVRADHGIAVRSTFGRLGRSFGEVLPPLDKRPKPLPKPPINLGKVHYVDYDEAVWPMGNALWPFVHKRLSFVHEQEVRALISRPSTGPDGLSDYHAEGPAHLLIAVDLDELIEAIYLSPAAPGWLFALVTKVCNRYGVHAEVRQSALSRDPRF